jgi:hypothetical protein
MAASFAKAFLVEDLRKKRGGEMLYAGVAAVGKHPGWQDFMDRLGIETESMLMAVDLLEKGILKNYEAVWGERRDAEDAAEFERRSRTVFEFYLLWQRGSQCLVGRVWKSGDRTPTGPRSMYPMTALAHIEAAPNAAMLSAAVRILDKVREKAIATRDPVDVEQILNAARNELRGAVAAAKNSGVIPLPLEQVEQFKKQLAGADGNGLHDIFYEFREKSLHAASQADARAGHLRVPAGFDDPATALFFWAEFCAAQLPQDVARLLVLAPDGRHVDIVIGKPEPVDFSFLRYYPAALPLANQIGFSVNAATRAQSEAFWPSFGQQPSEKAKAVESRRIAPNIPATSPPSPVSAESRPSANFSKLAIFAGLAALAIGLLAFFVTRAKPPTQAKFNLPPAAPSNNVQTAKPQTAIAAPPRVPEKAYVRINVEGTKALKVKIDGQSALIGAVFEVAEGRHDIVALGDGNEASEAIRTNLTGIAGKTNILNLRAPPVAEAIRPTPTNATSVVSAVVSNPPPAAPKKGFVSFDHADRIRQIKVDGAAIVLPKDGMLALDKGGHDIEITTISSATLLTNLTIVPDQKYGLKLPSKAVVTLTSNLRGAHVLLDGKDLGSTPLTNALPPGKAVFRATFAHLVSALWETELRDGPAEHEFKFAFGLANISSVPEGANISIGQQGLGKTPIHLIPLPAGQHNVVFELGGTNETKILTLSDNDLRPQSLMVNFQAKARRDPVVKKINGIDFVKIPEKGILVSKYEITEAQFIEKFRDKKSRWNDVANFPRSDMPIVRVGLQEATNFCGELGGRLPTVDEYNYFAEGATNGWTELNRPKGPAQIGTAQGDISRLGVSDTYGNVAEFCAKGSKVVARGYSFNVKPDPELIEEDKSEGSEYIGFRVVIDDPPK